MGKGKSWSKKGGGGSATVNLSSARGFGCIIATCDVNRSQEGCKELMNLLTQAIEVLYPCTYDDDTTHQTEDGKHLSMEDLLALEIEKSVNTKVVQSLQTGVKGLICVKICKHFINPVVLVCHIFNNVRSTHTTCSRHLCRVVPLEKVFFANEEEYKTNVQQLVKERFGAIVPPTTTVGTSSEEQDLSSAATAEKVSVLKRSGTESELESVEDPSTKRLRTDVVLESSCISESTPSAPQTEDISQLGEAAIATSAADRSTGGSVGIPRTAYCVVFKKRNHDVLQRKMAQDTVVGVMPTCKFYVNYRQPETVFVVEAFMNTAGIAYVENYAELSEFNLSKHQKTHAMGGEGSNDSVCDQNPAETDC